MARDTVPIIPRGLIIQLYNRGMAQDVIAQQMKQGLDVVQTCITDYEHVVSLLEQGYTVDEISAVAGVTKKAALEYLSLAYRFNPHLK